jgi:hypothetical protein
MEEVVLVVAGLVFTKLLDGAEAVWRLERVYLGGGWFGAHVSYAGQGYSLVRRLTCFAMLFFLGIL